MVSLCDGRSPYWTGIPNVCEKISVVVLWSRERWVTHKPMVKNQKKNLVLVDAFPRVYGQLTSGSVDHGVDLLCSEYNC